MAGTSEDFYQQGEVSASSVDWENYIRQVALPTSQRQAVYHAPALLRSESLL